MRKLLLLIAATGIGYYFFLPESKPSQTTQPTVQAISIPNIPVKPIPKKIAPKPPERKKYPALGSASRERVTQAVEFYQAKGITNVGVAYLVGNFAWESGLNPASKSGDGGKAWGIAQWHPSRRPQGLPKTLEGQMEYAWREIQAYPLRHALYGSNESLLMQGIKRWEGYGYEGKRFIYARTLLNHL